MEVNDLNWHSQEDGLVGSVATEHKTEPSEFFFIGCIYLGSIGGALAGSLFAKLFVGNIYPIAFGMLGCMLGTSVLCTLASLFPATLSTVHISKSEKHVSDN
jgi:uncharacterized membrane protein YeaQ/YmgE (transglycosylase-associated protein family)